MKFYADSFSLFLVLHNLIKKTGSGHSYPVAFIPLNLFNVLPVYSLTIFTTPFYHAFYLVAICGAVFYFTFLKKNKNFLYLP